MLLCIFKFVCLQYISHSHIYRDIRQLLVQSIHTSHVFLMYRWNINNSLWCFLGAIYVQMLQFVCPCPDPCVFLCRISKCHASYASSLVCISIPMLLPLCIFLNNNVELLHIFLIYMFPMLPVYSRLPISPGYMLLQVNNVGHSTVPTPVLLAASRRQHSQLLGRRVAEHRGTRSTSTKKA